MMIPTPNSDLMRIFDFTPADLETNRSERLSERQAKHLKAESDADRFVFGCLIYVGSIIGGILLFAAIIQPRIYAIDFQSGYQIVFIAFTLGFLYIRYRSNQRANKLALEKPYVGIVQGVATWRYVDNDVDRDQYQIIVDRKTFRVEKSRFRAFEVFMQHMSKQTVFRIYFAPEINRILSIEIIPQ